MKIFLGPSYGRVVEVDHMMAIFNLLRHRGITFHIEGNDALIERSRSKSATRFLESDADVWLSVDGDVLFQAEDALEICQQAMTLDVVSGLYVTRSRERCSPASLLERDVPVEIGGSATAVAIRWAATGFLAVHRRVFEKLAKRPDMPLCHPRTMRFRPFFLPFVTTDDQGEEILLSEDFAFCERARQEGFGIWLNPRVQLYHLGLYPYRVQDMAERPLPLQPVNITRFEDYRYRVELRDEPDGLTERSSEQVAASA